MILFFGSIFYYSWLDRKFSNIEIPKELKYDKPVSYLNHSQIDSLMNLEVNSDKIEVIGTGYGGYDFYMWHKTKENGELFVKAFEITSETELSETKLSKRTRNKVFKKSDKFQIYKGMTVIDEGTFEKFYPVRFELWFKASDDGEETILTKKFYLIDGWDR